jgi:hypothetical protein
MARWPRHIPHVLAALILAFAGWSRLAHIDATLPYPRHVDESALSVRAAAILRTNDYDPDWFHYPSGPIYLTVVGLAMGFVDAARAGELKDAGALGSVSPPYYEHPIVMRAPRRLFALVSIAAMLVFALLARRMYDTPWALPVTLAALTCSSLFFKMSWEYLNVDIVGTALVGAAVLAAVRGLDHAPSAARGVTAGLLAGLAASCKYTHGLAIVAIVVAMGVHRDRRGTLTAIAAALAGAVVGFLCASPYALLNVRRFASHVGYDAWHYATWHPGYTRTPGLPQLATYASDLAASFGWVLVVPALWGLVYAVKTNWRLAVVALAFPAVLLVYLSRYPVYFERNALPSHGTYAVLVAGGALALARWLREGRAQRWRERSPFAARIVGVVLIAALSVAAYRHRTLREQLVVRGDSRNLAVQWMRAELPPGTIVLVPTELGVHPQTLKPIRWAGVSALGQSNPASLRAIAADTRATHILWPEWGRDLRFAGQRELARVRQMALPGRQVAAFGTEAVLVNYTGGPVTRGDPRFSVIELAVDR